MSALSRVFIVLWSTSARSNSAAETEIIRAEATALQTKLTTVICEEITDSMNAAFSSFSSSYIPSALLSISNLLSLLSPCFHLPSSLSILTLLLILIFLLQLPRSSFTPPSHTRFRSELFSSLIHPPMSPFLFVSLIRA